MQNYYVTVVFCFGVPAYLRDLTLAEATNMYEANVATPSVLYCQCGVVGAPKPLYVWKAD